MGTDNIQSLRSHFQSSHFKIFKDLGVYYWVAGGSIRDFFLKREPKDIDFYFSTPEDRCLAKETLVKDGFKLVHSYHNHDVLTRGDTIYETFYNNGEDTPEKCIENFDFTICSCALDNRLIFYRHEDFFEDVKGFHLIRIPQKGRPALTTCKRLKKLLNNGYNIDKQNLVKWLNDIEKTLE